jgi:hypothetical protein
MARIKTIGFEKQSLTANVEITSTGGAPTIDTTTKRSGSAAMRAVSSGGGAAFAIYDFLTADSNVGHYARTYIYPTAASSASGAILAFLNTAGTQRGRIWMTTGGTLQLLDSAAIYGSDSPAVTMNAWNMVELFYFNNTGSARAELAARLNGVLWASTTTSTNVGGISRLAFGSIDTVTLDIRHDDLAINDTSGAAQNSWPGEGKVGMLLPNAAGDNAMGIIVGGTATAWEAVDEITPDDATTYYNLDANNDILDVNLQAASTTGMASTDTVTLVQVEARISTATAAGAAYNARIKSQASGTVVSGTSTSVGVDTNWHTNDDVAPRTPKLTSYTDPQGGAGWTPALLDTTQIGAIATDAAPDVYISNIWANVEWQPALTIIKSESVTVSESVSVSVVVADTSLSINKSDSITVSESIARLSELFIGKSDSTTVSEALQRALSNDVNVSDSTTASEALARLVESYVSKSDSTTVTESRTVLVPELVINRSDSVTVTESRQQLVESYVTRSDSPTVSEALQRVVESYVSKSEGVTVTEAVESLLTAFITKSDSATVSEAVSVSIESAGGVDLSLSVSDTATVTEALQRMAENRISTTENVSVSERRKVFLYGTSPVTVFPDADPEFTSSDGSVSVFIANPGNTWSALRDTAGNGAGPTGSTGNLIFIRAATTTNQWRGISRGVFMFDTSFLGDAITITGVTFSLKIVEKSDFLNILPDVDVYTSSPASTTDVIASDFNTIGTTSQTGSPVAYNDLVVDSFADFIFNATGISNIAKTGISKFGVRNANYDAADIAPAWISNEFTTVNANYADIGQGNSYDKPRLVISYVIGFSASASDSATVTESVTVRLESLVAETDTATVTETIRLEVNSSISKSDTVSVTDTATVTIAVTGSGSVNVSDSSTVSESIQLSVGTSLSVSDSTTVTESRQASVQSFVSKSESITVTESRSQVVESNRAVSDTATLTETVSVQVGRTTAVTDTATVTEATTILIPVLLIGVSDSTTVSESVSMLVVSDIRVSDSTTITEALQRSAEIDVSKTETVATTESVASLLDVSVGTSDTATVNEALTVAHITGIQVSVSDTATASEGITLATTALQVQVTDTANHTEAIAATLPIDVGQGETSGVWIPHAAGSTTIDGGGAVSGIVWIPGADDATTVVSGDVTASGTWTASS